MPLDRQPQPKCQHRKGKGLSGTGNAPTFSAMSLHCATQRQARAAFLARGGSHARDQTKAERRAKEHERDAKTSETLGQRRETCK